VRKRDPPQAASLALYTGHGHTAVSLPALYHPMPDRVWGTHACKRRYSRSPQMAGILTRLRVDCLRNPRADTPACSRCRFHGRGSVPNKPTSASPAAPIGLASARGCLHRPVHHHPTGGMLLGAPDWDTGGLLQTAQVMTPNSTNEHPMASRPRQLPWDYGPLLVVVGSHILTWTTP
jgi:hypothetical protein